MNGQNTNARFHELIGKLETDGNFYEQCMVAQKFDIGNQADVSDMANVAWDTLVRPPYPVCLFQMTEATTSTVHWFLVEDFSSEDIVNIQFSRFGLFADGFNLPFIWTHFLKKDDEIKFIVFKDFEHNEQMSQKELDTHCEEEDEYAWTVRAAKHLSHCFAVLACSNVETQENKPPRFINEKRIKKGKVPFFSYWTLHIKQNKSVKNNEQSGTHASPRLHLRRGHIRRLEGGKTVWVTHCLVGEKSTGIVQKDYLIKKASA